MNADNSLTKLASNKVKDQVTAAEEADQIADKAAREFDEFLVDLADIHARLEAHLAHRRLLLEESAVSQVRGTFRLARYLLVTGAMCLALGATGYAIFLPADDSDDETAATSDDAEVANDQQLVTQFSIAEIGDELGAQWEQCESKVLSGQILADSAEDSRASILVTEPQPCVGLWQIELDDGLVSGVLDIDADLGALKLAGDTSAENTGENISVESGGS